MNFRRNPILLAPALILGLTLIPVLSGGPQSQKRNDLMAQAMPRKSDLTGFAGTPWKATFTQVRDYLKNLSTSTTSTEKVEIINLVRNRTILVKRNDILYRYNFYKTPLQVQRLVNHQLTEEDFDLEEALLFHVKVTPSFIESTLIRKKLEETYGPPNRSTVNQEEYRGADIWEMGGGIIFQWYEPYNHKAYTRTIDYLSREMSAKILKEYADYFDAKEKHLLQMLILD